MWILSHLHPPLKFERKTNNESWELGTVRPVIKEDLPGTPAQKGEMRQLKRGSKKKKRKRISVIKCLPLLFSEWSPPKKIAN